MISKKIRHQQILALLADNGKMSPKELSEATSVSEMTIRRDIRELFDQKLVNAFYGGVTLVSGSKANIPQHKSLDIYHIEQEKHYDEKIRIAQYAYSLIESQDVICIDNGTTCCHMLDYFNQNTSCLVYSYSLRIINQINRLQNKNIQLFALGGYFHSHLQMFEYSGILDVIKTLHINKMFLGTVGVAPEGELSCVQPYEIAIRQTLMAQSDQIILLADSSKIGKAWYDTYGSIDDLTTFITDSGITIEQKKSLEDKGVNLVIV